MSIPRVPRHVELRKLAASGAHVGGIVALEDLPRIAGELLDRNGWATVELDFAVDEEGRRTIEGRIATELEVQCQRCLGPMRLKLAAEVHLAMVWSEEEIAALPKHYDGIVVDEEPSDLFELIEDELLLALPFAPRHEPGECTAGMEASAVTEEARKDDAATKENPFAVLGQYKGRMH